MSEAREPLSAPPAGPASDASPASNRPAEVATTDPRIEDYLDHVCAPLVGRVPYEARRELREEIRAHLEALVAARQEMGAAPSLAIREALAQFGDPRMVARRWLREWDAAACGTTRSARPATIIALGWFGTLTCVVIAMILAHSQPGGAGSALLVQWTSAILFAFPILSGIATGALAPARSALGTFYALAILAGATGLLAGQGSLLEVFDELPGFALVLCFLWMPLGCLASGLGSRLRRRFLDRWRPWQVSVRTHGYLASTTGPPHRP